MGTKSKTNRAKQRKAYRPIVAWWIKRAKRVNTMVFKVCHLGTGKIENA
jgi:hypothetical protein